MTLENQVVSLDLAKKLKELGVKQNSLFHWYISTGGTEISYYEQSYFERSYGVTVLESYSAFTVAELAGMVTPFMDSDGFSGIAHKDVPKHLQLDDKNMFATLYSPDYLAELLIYLLENNLT